MTGSPEIINAHQAFGLIGVVIMLAPLAIVAVCDALAWLEQFKDKRK